MRGHHIAAFGLGLSILLAVSFAVLTVLSLLRGRLLKKWSL